LVSSAEGHLSLPFCYLLKVLNNILIFTPIFIASDRDFLVIFICYYIMKFYSNSFISRIHFFNYSWYPKSPITCWCSNHIQLTLILVFYFPLKSISSEVLDAQPIKSTNIGTW